MSTLVVVVEVLVVVVVIVVVIVIEVVVIVVVVIVVVVVVETNFWASKTATPNLDTKIIPFYNAILGGVGVGSIIGGTLGVLKFIPHYQV